MGVRRNRFSTGGQAALIWGCFRFFACKQPPISRSTVVPEAPDPEYGYKLANLRRRLHEAPRRPLVLALGRPSLTARCRISTRKELRPSWVQILSPRLFPDAPEIAKRQSAGDTGACIGRAAPKRE
jgi:hypothetical protein